MKPNTQLLHSVWDESSEFLTKTNVDLEQIKLEEVIAAVFSNGPYYFYIVDFYDRQIKFMSPLVKEIHGLDSDTATFQDILDQIHPDDMSFVANAETAVVELLHKKIGSKNSLKYKVSYCFRMKTADGSYQLFNHQAIVLNVDENWGTCKALNIHTNISHLTTQNNYKVSAIGLFGEPSYLNLPTLNNEPLPKESSSPFSKREIQIIRLVSGGLTNEEIAAKLSISFNTVKNHRKNIFKKSGCSNVVQLITKCITDGLI